MSYETLIFKKKDGLAELTLNRPKTANSINVLMSEELLDVSIKCRHDKSIRAMLLTAKGKMFSAGGDLASFAKEGKNISNLLSYMTHQLHGAFFNFSSMRAPTVVSINGTAAGAGMSLACLGDISYCAESAKFTMAYTGAGLSPDGTSTYFLPRLIGIRKTKELMLTNRLLSAAEACDWGLVNEVFADDKVYESSKKLAIKLCEGPTDAFGAVKSLLNESYQNSLPTQVELEGMHIANLASGVDAQEGITAFLEKRKPNFKG
tara:strand:+ start:1013 stop:1798 length:786 start_codon:yes stop_codon:yes gene_type:complete